ncbi:MAG: tetratricopeptide repeat protein, partial [Acetobacteraceae bacterium]|nr:tetratricopeptide repeat protein [Acetobacteraceae bacterium]
MRWLRKSIASLFNANARYWRALIRVSGRVAQAVFGLRAIGRVLLDCAAGLAEDIAGLATRHTSLILLLMLFAYPTHAQTQSVETHGAQSPAVIANDVTITYGLSPDQMQQLTKAAAAGAVGPLADKIVELSQKLGVTRDATVTFLHILGQQEVPLESLGQKLHEVAEKYKSAMDRLAALDPEDPATRDLIVRADAALKAGHLDETDRFLSQAEQAEVAAARQAQEVVRQAQAAADQRLLRAAAASEVRGNIAMTKLQYLDAAQHFQEAVDFVPAGHPDKKGRFLLAKADALYHQGDERGDNAALVNSIVTYRLALREDDRDRVPRQWAIDENRLGNALVALGVRQGQTSSLKQAINTYSLALEVYSHDLGLVDWAITEANLGVALQRLGERESGTAQLELAVAAYRSALGAIAPYYAVLEQDTRERVPWIPWAVTQNNLGAALQTLGEREGSTDRLDGAVAAYHAVLEEYTRDRAPLQWALTQMNLGNVLQTLGEREGSTGRLEDAIAAYREALEECTRERVPLDWAATENNLGVVLRRLGQRDSTTSRLEEAVAAHRAALEEFTRDRAPLQWAMTENDLGIALKTLGERESGTARLEEAVAAYRVALEEYTPDGAPVQWAQTQMNLGNALLRLGQRADGTAQLEQAVAVYR